MRYTAGGEEHPELRESNFAPLARKALCKPSIPQHCRPESQRRTLPLSSLYQGGREIKVLQFAAKTPLLQNDNVCGFRLGYAHLHLLKGREKDGPSLRSANVQEHLGQRQGHYAKVIFHEKLRPAFRMLNMFRMTNARLWGYRNSSKTNLFTQGLLE